WRKKMTSAIQFSQNYVSEHWYQGGESNINILSLQSFEIKKFDETKRTEFEMRMDLKTGFYTTPSDTMRAFRVNYNLHRSMVYEHLRNGIILHLYCLRHRCLITIKQIRMSCLRNSFLRES
ncbi:MAG: DUF3078 domain-containing protein, partial [Bacteroidales bacterium]